MYGFAGGNTLPLSSSLLESENKGSDDDFSRSSDDESDSPQIRFQVTPSPDVEVERLGSLYGTDMKVKTNHDEGTNSQAIDLASIGNDSAEKNAVQAVEETQKNMDSSYKEEAFKTFLSRIFGAIDSETLDIIQEKLFSSLPDALAELMDDMTGAEILDETADLVELEADKDSKEGKEEENKVKQGKGKESGARQANKVGVHLAGVSFGSLQRQPQIPFSKDNPTQPRSYSATQVVYFLGWLPWDWVFFWISASLAFVSLLVLTALAITTCSCTT